MNNESFIPQAVAKIAELPTSAGAIAREVEAAPATNPIPTHRFINATLYVKEKLNDERQEAKRVELETGTRGIDPVAAPEATLFFIQTVMNEVSQAARLLFNANNREEFGNGIDFSQDVGERVGVYCANENIAAHVDADFRLLNNLHTTLAGQMDYLTDVKPLFYFTKSEAVKVGEVTVYESKYDAMSFDGRKL